MSAGTTVVVRSDGRWFSLPTTFEAEHYLYVLEGTYSESATLVRRVSLPGKGSWAVYAAPGQETFAWRVLDVVMSEVTI